MRYEPASRKVATSLACGLLVPFPKGTEVALGRYARDPGDGPVIPPSFPRLHSRQLYVYASPFGWGVVDREDLTVRHSDLEATAPTP